MIDSLKKCLLPLMDENTPIKSLKCAAVLLPLVIEPTTLQWHVLLTTRAAHLKHHPGQISFPGGGYERKDQNLSVTAIRETFEEVGIDPKHIELIGQLPQQRTISQYNITPFVGIIDSKYQITIDPNEVAHVFTAPLSFLTDSNNQKQVTEVINGTEYLYYTIQYKQYNIWGATARILVNLTRRLNSSTSYN